VRGVMERYLIEEITLEGLSHQELARLWESLFEAPPEPELLAMLHGATAGNPLAIRSALRGTLKSGALAQDRMSGRWRAMLPPEVFVAGLQRSVQLLSEGMAAHLSEGERKGAEQIASLGEVVARESALAMIGGAETLLESLMFKGIILATGTAVQALPGEISSSPLLAFTHSLLHRRLAQQAAVNADCIVGVIAAGLPLYSALPFLTLAERPRPLGVTADQFRSALNRTLDVASNLDRGPDWRLAVMAWRAAGNMIESSRDRCTPLELAELQARYLMRGLSLRHRGEEQEESAGLLEQLIGVLGNAEPDQLIRYRLGMLIYRIYLSGTRYQIGVDRENPYRREVEDLIARFPELRHTQDYVSYLYHFSYSATLAGDHAIVRGVEREMEAISAEPGVDESFRREMRRTLGPDFLGLIDTEEELARRLDLLAELESFTGDQHYADVLFCKIGLLERIGRMDDLHRVCREAQRHFRDQNLIPNLIYALRSDLHARASFGMSHEAMEREAAELCAMAPPAMAELQSNAMGYQLLTIGLLRGDIDWAGRMAERFVSDRNTISPARQVLLNNCGDKVQSSLAAADNSSEIDRLIAALCALAGGSTAPDDTIIAGMVGDFLRTPVIRLEDVINLHAVASLLDQIGRMPEHEELAATTRPRMTRALTLRLGWLAERGLHLYIRPIIDRYTSCFSRAEATAWRARAKELARPDTAPATGADDRSLLTMLGTIEIRSDGREPIRPRGSRLRTMLGVLVADQMLDEPLSQREFCRIAAGDQAEIEDARKTVNLTVHRLRESLGHEAILTDGETPRLNLRLLRVDLLDADRLLAESSAALRDGMHHRAMMPLIAALETVRGEVPFPTLYEDFFEAAREDFENRLRFTLIKTAQGLMRDGDAASAERILRHGFSAMPDDEEITELLCGALLQLGKRTEAQRIRLKFADADA
ncbi:MAG: BTAD domain-containing putative transcriptional regulator, partial [Candidatus Kapaibacterium sp.]